MIYMQLGLQEELESVLGHKVMPYWKAYLLGIPTLFIYTLVWMARISEELKAIAIDMGIEGPHTSWWHMFGWNTFGILLMGPAVATHRFFRTLNRVERELNHEQVKTFESCSDVCPAYGLCCRQKKTRRMRRN